MNTPTKSIMEVHSVQVHIKGNPIKWAFPGLLIFYMGIRNRANRVVIQVFQGNLYDGGAMGHCCYFSAFIFLQFIICVFLLWNCLNNNLITSMMYSIQTQPKVQMFENGQAQRFTIGPFTLSRQGTYQPREFRENAQWSISEKAKYAAFIQFYNRIMETIPYKHLWGYFKLMSDCIKSRNYRQCKLYHQKMLKKLKSINNIIDYFKASSAQFQACFQKQRIQIKQKTQKKLSSKTSKSVSQIVNQPGINQGQNNSDQPQKYDKSMEMITAMSPIPYPSSENSESRDSSMGMDSSQQKQDEEMQMGHSDFYQAYRQKEEEWKECHLLFVQWAFRFRNLALSNL